MENVKSNKPYEHCAMHQVLGETIRPGGFTLTRRALEFCGLQPGERILDVGCGMGASVAYLREKAGLDAVGLDPSDTLLKTGLERQPGLPLYLGRGEELPFATGSMKAVLAECSLSLAEDVERVLAEMARVLEDGGWLIISDLYRRDPSVEGKGPDLSWGCLGRAFDCEELERKIVAQGFTMALWEDYTVFLKDLVIRIIMDYGSLDNFYRLVFGADSTTRSSGISQMKPGYFLLIAKKGVQTINE